MTARIAERVDANESPASIDIKPGGADELTIHLQGRLDASTTGRLWREATKALETRSPRRLRIEASGIRYADLSGIGLLVELSRRQHQDKREAEIRGLRPEFQRLLDLFPPEEFERYKPQRPRPTSLPEEVGRAAYDVWRDAVALVAFVGELTVALPRTLAHPRRVRWGDLFAVAETAGVNALPVVSLISFIVGLIMAFQAAIPMKRFGAEIFVADLVALAMLRELGPLMTAIILAGRSGSAFAAEIGTMKVKEEIDALTTMGLDPMRFLVVPRVIAAVVTTPLLAAYANLVGLVGGGFVVVSLGYSVTVYIHEVVWATDYVDFLSGIAKAIVFGLIVAGIGCVRGLQTKMGASAVGESTTRAVVSSIILIIVADGIFSVVYYYLGI